MLTVLLDCTVIYRLFVPNLTLILPPPPTLPVSPYQISGRYYRSKEGNRFVLYLIGGGGAEGEDEG